jgi:hypothetical protein
MKKTALPSEPARVEPLMTTYDRHSALWMKLAKHLEQRLDILRKQNDGPMTPEETERQRGRIAEVKSLLTLGKEPIQAE